jgi:hypothetical protein
MTPVETAPVTTPESAPATTPAADGFSSFLGVEAETLPSLQPRETPAPGGAEPEGSQESTEEAGAGEEQAELPEETIDGEPATELEPQGEETDDNWLPTEQAKEFPLEVLQQYAEKRGYDWAKISADPTLQRLLKDKLNTDIYVEQMRQETENQGFEETTPEETELPADPAAAADPRAEYRQRVETIAQKIDPAATEALGKELLAAFGVTTDVKKLEQMLADPKLTPEARQEVQSAIALSRNAGVVGTTLAKGAIDLILTSLPEILPAVMESVAPGLLGAYQGWSQVQAASGAWNEVSQARDGRGQPVYSNLPQYGTKEFAQLTVRAEQQLGLAKGALGEMAGRGFIREAYTMVAQVASGQRVSPQAVSRAVSVGRQQERNQQERRATGRALGAGQQSRQFGQEEPADAVRDELRRAIAEQNSTSTPFAGARTVGS